MGIEHTLQGRRTASVSRGWRRTISHCGASKRPGILVGEGYTRLRRGLPLGLLNGRLGLRSFSINDRVGFETFSRPIN